MPHLGSLLTDWFGSDTSWIAFILGCLLGWIAGLVWWWYFTGRETRGKAEVMRLEGRPATVETTLTARTGELDGLQEETSDSAAGESAESTDLNIARDGAIARLTALEGELSAMPVVPVLEAAADDGSADVIAGLERQLVAARELAADAIQAHQGCDTRLEQLTRDVDARTRRVDELTREVDELTPAKDAEIARLGEAATGDHAAAIAALTAERDEVQALLSKAQEKLSGRRAEMESQLAVLRRERDEARKDARRQLLDQQNEFDESSRHAAEDLVRLREERRQFQSQLRLAGAEVERMRDEATGASASDAESDRLRSRLTSIEGKHASDLQQRDGKIDQLLSRVEALQDELHNPPKPKRPARDELQRIFGIGPVLERKLHAMGYLRFEDIAAWKRPDVERVAEQLGSFPDRIERDAWVAQAGRLAVEMQREYED